MAPLAPLGPGCQHRSQDKHKQQPLQRLKKEATEQWESRDPRRNEHLNIGGQDDVFQQGCLSSPWF